MRLYDHASVIRSKNAGPFTLTIDLMFDTEATFQHVLVSPNFTPAAIARLYNVLPAQIHIHPFHAIRTIKVTLPRQASSGSPADLDTYGCQQHFPLGELDI